MIHMPGRFGYSIHPQGRVVPVGSFQRTCASAREQLWDTRCAQDRASLYRQADGWRFVGYVTYDGRFIDQRVPA